MTEKDKLYEAWLAKAMLPHSVIEVLFDIYEDPEDIFDHFVNEGKEFAGGKLPERFFNTLNSSCDARSMDRLKSLLDSKDIGIFSYKDPCYPFLLKQIRDMPSFLFYKGDINALSGEHISFVGTRSPSAKAQQATQRITERLSSFGISIVSGLAYGIDTAAHSGCIKGGSPTIAVLGCGPDVNYPVENEMLRKRIIDTGGLIITEYFPGEKPCGWHFPYRNRIISGLSKATVLMEARLRSGSMTTVRHALDQGRDVFAWPNDPDSIYSEAAHELLRDGARYFLSAEDILDDLDIVSASSEKSKMTDVDPVHNKISESQKKILKALEYGETSFDDIVIKTDLFPAEVASELTMLQIMCKITVLPGKKYALSPINK